MTEMRGNRAAALAPKVVVMVESYFQDRDYRRFGIATLLAAGFAVEVWEVFRAWRTAYADGYVPADKSAFEGVRHFARICEVVRAIGQLRPDSVVLSIIPDRYETRSIFRTLERRGLYFGELVSGLRSAPGIRQRRPVRTWRTLRNSVFHRIPGWLRGSVRPRFGLFCGGANLAPVAAKMAGADLIWTHALDYDIALEVGWPDTTATARHIVFLDEYVPFHPDYLAMGIAAPNTAEEYYPPLNRLFVELERAMGLPVVVAAHPRSKYDGSSDYFSGRSVVQGETCALIRDAALVVTHCSTANNFTLIYRKPALVVTTNGLRQSYYGVHIEATAETLGAPLINLDAGIALNGRTWGVDEERYARETTLRVKRPGTPNRNSWQIFTEHLRTITRA